MKSASVVFSAHPPERRRRASVTLYAPGSCCCCCCCLHTIGGLIGAAVAPAIGSGSPPSLCPYYDEPAEDDLLPLAVTGTGIKPAEPGISSGPTPQLPHYAPEEHLSRLTYPSRTGPSAVALFWWLVLGACVLTMFVTFFSTSFAPNLYGAILVGVFIVVMCLPLGQLASAVLVALVLLCSTRPDKSYQFKQLGKIALGLVLGTVADILLMVGIVQVLRH